MGQIKNIFPLILRSSRSSRWLRTSGLRIFKERRRNFVREWLYRNKLSTLESVFKGMFYNLKRMCDDNAYSNGFNFLEKKDRNISSA